MSDTSARSQCRNDCKQTAILGQALAQKFAWLPSILFIGLFAIKCTKQKKKKII